MREGRQIARLDPWRFDVASDPEVLRPGLERGLERASGGRLQVVDLELPRAFPRPQGGITLQLCARLLRAGSAEPVVLVLGGHLLGESEDWPDYVATHAHEVLRFEALGLVVPLLPFDPKLGLLPQLLDDSRALELLRQAGVAGLEG